MQATNHSNCLIQISRICSHCVLRSYDDQFPKESGVQGMSVSTFVWNRLRRLNQIPGAYSLFRILARLMLRNGQTFSLRFGPARGLRWKHHRRYQPWMAVGLYEPETARLLFQSLKTGDIFYDVGANAGYYTLVAAKAVGSTGKVVAFEPVPANAAHIQEQIALNHFENACRVEQLAISDAKGSARLLVPGRNANSHLADIEAPHIADSKNGRHIEVDCVTMDDYVSSRNEKPSVIKLDVEGAEVKVLLGASRLLSGTHKPVLFVTAHSASLHSQVREILANANYDLNSMGDTIHAIPRQGRD